MPANAIHPAARDSISVQVEVPAGVSAATLRRWVRTARRRLPARPGQVIVSVIGSAAMRRLNRRWRKRDRPTNVLSFQYDAGRAALITPERVWGEILICPAVIRREAPRFSRTYRAHLRALVEHGLIHLLGLDHATARQQKTWQRYERRLKSS